MPKVYRGESPTVVACTGQTFRGTYMFGTSPPFNERREPL